MVYAAINSNKLDSHYTVLFAAIQPLNMSPGIILLFDQQRWVVRFMLTCTVYPNIYSYMYVNSLMGLDTVVCVTKLPPTCQ